MLVLSCASAPSSSSSSSSSGSPPQPEVVRSASRVTPNENKAVVLEGLAVDVAGRACVRFDRNDTFVPIAGRASWDAGLRQRPVRARGTLERHAEENDPVTGVASLELANAHVEPIALPADGRIRSAPERDAADGRRVEIEGLAYRSRIAPAVCLYGGLVWVRGVPFRAWDPDTMDKTIVVCGTLKRIPPPFESPPVEPWEIDAESYALVPGR
jgi:hypothetical protein